jgi:hypothetical protein
MFLENEHSLLDVLYLRAGVVYAAEFISVCNVKTSLFLKVSVPMKKLRRLIFGNIGLKKFPEFASEVCRPLLTANISENRVVNWICNVWESVVL